MTRRKKKVVTGRRRLLTDEQIQAAREYFKTRITAKQYAANLGVATSTLRKAIAGQKYKQPSDYAEEQPS